MKVLIVDDEPVNRKILDAQTRQWGYAPVFAEDGVQALDALRAPDAPQLVILDWQMPNMCGDEVCRQARIEFGARPIRIILLTANRITKEDMVAGLEAGADDYLRKPWDAAELKARLQTAERAVQMQNESLAKMREANSTGTHNDGDVIMCRYCQRFRGPNRSWRVEPRLADTFSQGRILSAICEECLEKQLVQITLESL